MAAAFAMTSCSKEPGTGRGDGEQTAIVLGSSVLGVETRGAGVINDDYTTFSAGIVGYTGTATVAAPSFTQDPIVFTSGVSTTVTGKFYPVDGSAVNFVGYAPSGGTLSAGSVSFTIDGTDDVMYAGVASGTKVQAIAGTHPNLVFEHMLTQLQFQVVAEDVAGVPAVAAWGDVTKIEVLSQPNTIALALASGTATASGTAVFTGFSGTQALTTTLTGVGNGTMIFPVNAATLSLKVYTVNCPEGQQVDLLSKTFVAGSAYKVNLTFKATAIVLTATVTPWADGGSTGIDVK